LAIDSFVLGCCVVGYLNISLALSLVAVYSGVYRRMRTPFTIGLLLFAGAFLLQNGLVAYAYTTMMPLIPVSLGPYLLGIGILEAAGLSSILWTALR
jgi:hypothetical protein